MKRIVWVAVIATGLLSCKGKDAKKGFEVKGTITNNSAKMIYLEELPISAQRIMVVDSAEIGKDGKYKLGTDMKESSVYNLRLDKTPYPFASVINDTKQVTLDVTFNKENKDFPEKYEVKGSPASQQMKDFMTAFNGQLQAIYFNQVKMDSVQKSGAGDSALKAVQSDGINIAASARTLLDETVKKTDNPALTMFALGYYQSMANNPGYQLIPLENEELQAMVSEIAGKYPNHSGLAEIQKSLAGFVGMPAPDFELPDPNGKPVKLSSFRGKYVLVDFWASWCKPCRMENPNVVKAWTRFKDKNFTILGVSLDREGGKDDWMKAVMADNLTWNHVSDLSYWNSPVVQQYKIGGIPYNVLVDPDGKIIGEKLFGPALENKLAEVLK